jgi:hypothetical protein
MCMSGNGEFEVPDAEHIQGSMHMSSSGDGKSMNVDGTFTYSWLGSRSLLKISFVRRVDHAKSRTLFCLGFRSATIDGNRGLRPLLHALCASSFGIRIG